MFHFAGNQRTKDEAHENQLVNEVMLTAEWEVVKAWAFKSKTHINLLELKSVERLVQNKARKKLSLVDSNVS